MAQREREPFPAQQDLDAGESRRQARIGERERRRIEYRVRDGHRHQRAREGAEHRDDDHNNDGHEGGTGAMIVRAGATKAEAQDEGGGAG